MGDFFICHMLTFCFCLYILCRACCHSFCIFPVCFRILTYLFPFGCYVSFFCPDVKIIYVGCKIYNTRLFPEKSICNFITLNII